MRDLLIVNLLKSYTMRSNDNQLVTSLVQPRELTASESVRQYMDFELFEDYDQLGKAEERVMQLLHKVNIKR